jgi:hypothetical protein
MLLLGVSVEPGEGPTFYSADRKYIDKRNFPLPSNITQAAAVRFYAEKAVLEKAHSRIPATKRIRTLRFRNEVRTRTNMLMNYRLLQRHGHDP